MGTAARHVKGVLFADYVRMIRSRKDVDWSLHLDVDARAALQGRADPDAWYPMAIFERLGNAILRVIAGGEMQLVRLWGYHQADELRVAQPLLVQPADPIETLRRFRVLRATYFDFEALTIPLLHEDEADVVISYGMGMPAEEAASWQAIGFFERLLEMAGATDVEATFVERWWGGDGRTRVKLKWRMTES